MINKGYQSYIKWFAFIGKTLLPPNYTPTGTGHTKEYGRECT